MTRTVYAAASNKATSGSRLYHTNDDCPWLGRAKAVVEKDVKLVVGHWEECDFCSGEADVSESHVHDGSYDAYNALSNADPDTPIGGDA